MYPSRQEHSQPLNDYDNTSVSDLKGFDIAFKSCQPPRVSLPIKLFSFIYCYKYLTKSSPCPSNLPHERVGDLGFSGGYTNF
jgi:hypothetical protein